MSDNKEKLTLAVEIGDALLRNGAEIYRVEDTILHILDAFELENFDVYVLSNGIFASANEDREDACSIIRHVPLGDVHLGKIAALNQLSREICENTCGIEEAWERLRQCNLLPSPAPWIQGIACGIGCGCFCYIFGGKLLDSVCAFILGIFLQYMRMDQAERKSSKFMANIIGSAFLTASRIKL